MEVEGHIFCLGATSIVESHIETESKGNEWGHKN